jgi:monovalent cation:proton antiporter-2 (CPA2) family protein
MSETRYLIDILILLGAAVVAVPVFRRLGLSSILGYLTAGAVVGPWGFGFIGQVDEIRHIAEFGVVFLLFVIGIELKPSRLWLMRRTVFGLGMAQVVATGLVLAGIAMLFGLSGNTAFIIGFGLALSSTAFGIQSLTERGELNSSFGRAAFSVLLLQDLAIVPLLMLVSFWANEFVHLETVQLVVLEALLVIAVVILAGRYLLNPLLHQVAASRSAEVFTAAAVFAVLGIAWLMQLFGLSMALGAFLAGLMLADSRYRHQVVADILPFRGLLLGLFFMGVGMSINFGLMGELGWWLLLLVGGLMATKAFLLWGLSRLMRVGAGDSIRVALLLSQSGEFAFVLFGLAMVSGIMAQELFQQLLLIVALSMAATPLVASMGTRIRHRKESRQHPHHVSRKEHEIERRHVIVAGFGRVGRRVVQVLVAGGVPYLGLDADPDRVVTARSEGVEVFYGDASRLDVLKAAGTEQAAALVVTLDQREAAERLVSVIRQHFPDLPIYVRAIDSDHGKLLRKVGASVVISEMLEVGLHLGGSVLKDQGFSGGKVHGLLQEIRGEYYSGLEGKPDSGDG